MLPTPASGRCESSCVLIRAWLRLVRRQRPPSSSASSHGSGPCAASVGQRGVLPHRHHADAPEPADVAQLQHPPVVERPPRPHVRIELAGSQPQHAGHPEVDDQLAVVVEREQQVLARAARPRRCAAPAANGADANFGDGCPHASVIARPATSGSSCRRTVSTSGSSGIARQHAGVVGSPTPPSPPGRSWACAWCGR